MLLGLSVHCLRSDSPHSTSISVPSVRRDYFCFYYSMMWPGCENMLQQSLSFIWSTFLLLWLVMLWWMPLAPICPIAFIRYVCQYISFVHIVLLGTPSSLRRLSHQSPLGSITKSTYHSEILLKGAWKNVSKYVHIIQETNCLLMHWPCIICYQWMILCWASHMTSLFVMKSNLGISRYFCSSIVI